MKIINQAIVLFVAITSSTSAFCYTVPSPLKGIEVKCVVAFDPSASMYKFDYQITNPAANGGEVGSVSIFLGQDSQKDVQLSSAGLTQCTRFHSHSSASILSKVSIVPVGSSSPDKWSCGYQSLHGYSEGSFGWGSIDESYNIKPGASLTGLRLSSFGLPAIRTILVEPDINEDLLPPEYSENVQKTDALRNSVKWIGQTLGPKAPPKVFDAGSSIAYLLSLVSQSRTQGWIDNDGIVTSLNAKLNTAQAKISAGDTKTAKNVLGAFLNDVQAQNGKHLSSEAYALLYFNGKYLVDHL